MKCRLGLEFVVQIENMLHDFNCPPDECLVRLKALETNPS